MNMLQNRAVALFVLVLTGIWATAVAQSSQISVDCEACTNPNDAAAPEPAIAAWTRLLEAFARGTITNLEGAAVYVARGNLYAVQGDIDLIARLCSTRTARAPFLTALARWLRAATSTVPWLTTTAPLNSTPWTRMPIRDAGAPITKRRTMPLQSLTMTRRSAFSQACLRRWRSAAMLLSGPGSMIARRRITAVS
jgi:hypothetical protein